MNRDFSSTELLPQFYSSIEISLRDKGNESSMYIGKPFADFRLALAEQV